MSFMDKVKAQAEVALTKAQQGVEQGQAKLNQFQAAKSHDALLKDFGSAYYAQQRSGGSADAVLAALAALDTESTEASAPAAAPDAPPAPPAAPPAAPGDPATPPPP